MTTPYALARLVLRPGSLLLLYLVALASSFAFILDQPLARPAAVETAGGPALSVGALWRLAILLPAATAVALSILTNEAQQSRLTWTLPHFRSGLFAGKAITAVLVATIAGALVAWVAGPWAGAAAFGAATAAFASATVMSDPATPKPVARLILAALLALVWFTHATARFATWQPTVAVFAGAVVAYVLLRRDASADVARRRAGAPASLWLATTDSDLRRYLATHPARARDWTVPLWGWSLRHWISAGQYEAFRGRSHGFPRLLLSQFILVTPLAWYLGEPRMVAWMPAMIAFGMPLWPRGPLLYPISRLQRARVVFWSDVVQTVAVLAAAVGALLLLYAVGTGSFAAGTTETLGETLLLVLAVGAWSPIAHWSKIVGPLFVMPTGPTRRILSGMTLLMIGMGAALQSHKWLSTSPVGAEGLHGEFALLGALALITYAGHWFALRWYHARRDLRVP